MFLEGIFCLYFLLKTKFGLYIINSFSFNIIFQNNKKAKAFLIIYVFAKAKTKTSLRSIAFAI